mmetsp:Transcript_25155/g.51367  ORF Transcript_25155/g.51367 Transcript_25155/m.51367 type:complete len:218 (-) Transcript_25155:295-948(-)
MLAFWLEAARSAGTILILVSEPCSSTNAVRDVPKRCATRAVLTSTRSEKVATTAPTFCWTIVGPNIRMTGYAANTAATPMVTRTPLPLRLPTSAESSRVSTAPHWIASTPITRPTTTATPAGRIQPSATAFVTFARDMTKPIPESPATAMKPEIASAPTSPLPSPVPSLRDTAVPEPKHLKMAMMALAVPGRQSGLVSSFPLPPEEPRQLRCSTRFN